MKPSIVGIDGQPFVDAAIAVVVDAVADFRGSGLTLGSKSSQSRDGPTRARGVADTGRTRRRRCRCSRRRDGYGQFGDPSCPSGTIRTAMTRPSVNPGAAEVCNGIDDDCDGSIDEGLTIDADNDGFTSFNSCRGARTIATTSIPTSIRSRGSLPMASTMTAMAASTKG